jgi:hypothetical protein
MFWGVELVEDKATKKPFGASHNLTAKIVKAGLEVRSPCSALCRAALCCAVPCRAVPCCAVLCCSDATAFAHVLSRLLSVAVF